MLRWACALRLMVGRLIVGDTKHAPKTYAPWFAWKDVNGVWQVGPSTNDAAAFVWRDEQSEATARLIASAPEMLEAVRIAIGNVRSLGPAGALSAVHTPYREWLSHLEAIYAKATGAAALASAPAAKDPQ